METAEIKKETNSIIGRKVLYNHPREGYSLKAGTWNGFIVDKISVSYDGQQVSAYLVEEEINQSCHIILPTKIRKFL